MGAFDIVDTPKDKKIMEGVFSFKTKYDSEGNVLKYAARGNVNGSKQEPGTFGDTFALTENSAAFKHMRASGTRGKRDPAVVRAYQQCVGACTYLTCFTRGDCSVAVNQCVRFMNNPGLSHIAAIKRALRYLAGSDESRTVSSGNADMAAASTRV